MSYNVGDKVEVCTPEGDWVPAEITSIKDYGLIYVRAVNGHKYVSTFESACKSIRVPLSSDEAFINECEESGSPRLKRAARMLKDALALLTNSSKDNTELKSVNRSLLQENEALRAKIAQIRSITLRE